MKFEVGDIVRFTSPDYGIVFISEDEKYDFFWADGGLPKRIHFEIYEPGDVLISSIFRGAFEVDTSGWERLNDDY